MDDNLHNEFTKEIMSFFTEEEIKAVLNSVDKDGYKNPLKNILENNDVISSLNFEEDRRLMLFKTNRAFKIIKEKNNKWLNSKKDDLLSSDYENVAASLGEIRAYSQICVYLYEEGKTDTLTPVSTKEGKPSPDFMLTSKDYNQEKYIVDFEVFTKTPDKESQKGQITGSSVYTKKGISRKITITESIHSPFSREKRKKENNKIGSTLRHLIHLFTQIKNGDKQFIDSHINVLWIDLCDDNFSMYDSFLSFAFPTKIKDGVFKSSVLWHAHYGKKGMLVLHEDFKGESITRSIAELEHNGRFYLENNKTDFVIFYFPKQTVVFENPNSSKKIPEKFRRLLTYLSDFNSAESRIDFPAGSLKILLDDDIKNLNNLYEYIKDRKKLNDN